METERKQKRKYIKKPVTIFNYFYVVYEIETIYKIPVYACDTVPQLGEFFGVNMETIRPILSRHRNGRMKKPLIRNSLDGHYYFVRQYKVINQETGELEELPIYKDQSPEDFYIQLVENERGELVRRLVYEVGK